jgi:NADPH:quinone reductase
MRAWLWDGSPGLNHLRLAEVAEPVAKYGEVVMAVHHAALNPADRYLAEKVYPYPVYPSLLHLLARDGMGTITQVGPGVKDVQVGNRRAILRGDSGVFRWGSFAEAIFSSRRVLNVSLACH